MHYFIRCLEELRTLTDPQDVDRSIYPQLFNNAGAL